MRDPTTKGIPMFNKIDDEKKLVILSTLDLAIASPFILAARAKKKVTEAANQHPMATSIVLGVVGGSALAVALIDGDKVPADSLYAKMFN